MAMRFAGLIDGDKVYPKIATWNVLPGEEPGHLVKISGESHSPPVGGGSGFTDGQFRRESGACIAHMCGLIGAGYHLFYSGRAPQPELFENLDLPSELGERFISPVTRGVHAHIKKEIDLLLVAERMQPLDVNDRVADYEIWGALGSAYADYGGKVVFNSAHYYSQAVHWFSKSVECDDTTSYYISRLVSLYEQGVGVDKNLGVVSNNVLQSVGHKVPP